MLLAVVSLLGGLVALVKASDWMVDGAVGLAQRFGVPPLVVGMTVIAYGTSLPELVVSLIAGYRGVDDIAVGNIVGSNVANIGLVLGVTALIHPIVVQSKALLTRDLPLLLLTTAAGVYFFVDGVVVLWEGLVLGSVAVGFTIMGLKTPDVSSDEPEASEGPDSLGKSILLTTVGIVGLVGGAHFMVDGGTVIARHFGISERVIGLTIVAVGTSLPELAACVAGAVKGHPGIAIGNVVGSNLFNLAFVLGTASMIRPMKAPVAEMTVELGLMIGLTAVMWLMMVTDRKVTRIEGGLLATTYAAFLTWLAITTTAAAAGA